jgi:hypothetical protein
MEQAPSRINGKGRSLLLMKWADRHDGTPRLLHLGYFGSELGKIRSFSDSLDVFSRISHEPSVTGSSKPLPERERKRREARREGREWASLLIRKGIKSPGSNVLRSSGSTAFLRKQLRRLPAVKL